MANVKYTVRLIPDGLLFKPTGSNPGGQLSTFEFVLQRSHPDFQSVMAKAASQGWLRELERGLALPGSMPVNKYQDYAMEYMERLGIPVYPDQLRLKPVPQLSGLEGGVALIKVKASRDRMGNIEVTPVNKRHRRKYAAHMKEMTGHETDSAFFQEGGDASEFLGRLPARLRRDLDEGYDVVFKVDPWEFGTWLGYDAHEVAL